MSEKNSKEFRTTKKAGTQQANNPPYLDHGVPSLVAQDNPDDSQLGAPPAQGKGRDAGSPS